MVSSWVRRGVGGLCVGAGVCLFSPDAAASHKNFRLEYKAPAECAGEQAVRDGVTMRLGLDPFVETDPKTISVEVTRRKPTGYHAKITIVEGEKTRVRELDSVDSRCSEMEADLAFVLRMIVEPVLIRLPSEQAPPESQDKPSPPEEPKETPTLVELPEPPKDVPPFPKHIPAPKPVTFDISAGVLGAAFATPGQVAVGGMLGGSLNWRSLRFGLSFQGLTDVPGATKEVLISMSLWSGSVAPCLGLNHWALCGVVTGGWRQLAARDGISIMSDARSFVALGPRVEREISLIDGQLSMSIHLDVNVHLVRNNIITTNGDASLWSCPPMFGTVGVRLVKPL